MQHSALPYVDANVWYITLLLGAKALASSVTLYVYMVFSSRYGHLDTDYPYHFASDIEV
jgi:hypothetical protein